MKGRMKDKIKIILIVLASIIGTTLLITLAYGRINTQEIIIVSKDGIDVTKPLSEQLDFFTKKEFLVSEIKYFGGTVVTDLSELENKKSTVGLVMGSPVLKSTLYAKDGGGKFAIGFPKGFTVRALPAATVGLPPMAPGDKINIGITYKMEKLDDEGQRISYDVSSIVLEELEVINVIGPDIYVKVTLQEDVVFEVLKTIGVLYFQLPGQSLEQGEIEEIDGNNTITSDEILKKIQEGEILNTEINLKELLEKGQEVKEGTVVEPVKPGEEDKEEVIEEEVITNE
jgi:hypothetical protein